LALTLEDQNINIVKLSFSAFNEGDFASLADLYSPDYLHHSPDSVEVVDWPEYEHLCRIVRHGYPDLQFRIICIFADSDKVAVRYVWEYSNDSYQFKRYYPTGLARGSANSIFKIKNSRIVSEWCEYDPAGIKSFCSVYKRLDHSR